MTARLEPLGRIGALVHGVDLTSADQPEIDFIREALLNHHVVFFREQSLDPESLLDFAGQFGSPTPYPYVEGLPGLPEVIEVKKLPGETVNFGGVWHSDTAYLPQPASAALLYGVDIPETGGDTIFTNMHLVLESLSPGLKKLLSSLTAVNDADKAAISATRQSGGGARVAHRGLKAEHPAIREHPLTGRELLYVDRAHTTHFTGMTEAESAPLLEYLFDLIEQPEFSCRFHWQPGSLAFWDNCACQHYPVNDYDGQLRRMYRVSLA